jgi:hypothetical protein
MWLILKIAEIAHTLKEAIDAEVESLLCMLVRGAASAD